MKKAIGVDGQASHSHSHVDLPVPSDPQKKPQRKFAAVGVRVCCMKIYTTESLLPRMYGLHMTMRAERTRSFLIGGINTRRAAALSSESLVEFLDSRC